MAREVDTAMCYTQFRVHTGGGGGVFWVPPPPLRIIIKIKKVSM